MDDKELTSVQKARRKYEEKNKEARKAASAQFSTFIPRATFQEINAFLERHKITKVDLINAGYYTLKEQYEQKEQK